MTDVPPTDAYTGLVTSEHSDKPNFMASLLAIIEPIAEIIEEQCDMPGLFDLDVAVGQQLDIVGQWVGASRYLKVPAAVDWFTWGGDAAHGWGHGYWFGPYESGSTLNALSDADYRAYLKATILANHWDGSISGAYAILAALAPGATFYISDGGDMSMSLYIPPSLTPVQKSLITENYVNIKPAGVRLNIYNQAPPVIFAWDSPTPAAQFGGWGTGNWTEPLASY
jgi:hypothetical protein